MSSAPPPLLAPTAAEIARDATWLAQAIDPSAGIVRMVAMTADAYREASFLDDRMLQQTVRAATLPWAQVASAAEAIERDDGRWIFHIGHVGSTLIARLLGELSGVLSVREPRFLRDIAALGPGERAAFIPATRKLFSRSFAADQVALAKATSFVSEIAGELVPADGRALFVYARPRNYIASILAGENSVMELDALASSRAQRMAKRVGEFAHLRSHADLAAAAWACEMTALEVAAEALPRARIMWVDFDRLLGDVGGGLGEITQRLELGASADEVSALAGSPLLMRYSKALEYDYSAGLRCDLIAEATARFESAIDGAVEMLAAKAETSALLARALGRAKEN